MYLCYIDESGVPSIPGNSSHFVLAGISVPIWHWKNCDKEIARIKKRYGIEHEEIHTAWILRPYLEQRKINNFQGLSYEDRRREVARYRTADLLKLQRAGNPRHYKQTKKNYAKTNAYIHLAYEERKALIHDLALIVSNWRSARLFAECIDKVHFDPQRNTEGVDVQAFEQLVSRFEHYLTATSSDANKCYGLLIHDNNDTIAKKHTKLMKDFYSRGTLWTNLAHLIETPLFVDSQLTGMVQIADLCSYAIRRYLEKNEHELFDLVFKRADRRGRYTVGVRHFTEPNCSCRICQTHSS